MLSARQRLFEPRRAAVLSHAGRRARRGEAGRALCAFLPWIASRMAGRMKADITDLRKRGRRRGVIASNSGCVSQKTSANRDAVKQQVLWDCGLSDS